MGTGRVDQDRVLKAMYELVGGLPEEFFEYGPLQARTGMSEDEVLGCVVELKARGLVAWNMSSTGPASISARGVRYVEPRRR